MGFGRSSPETLAEHIQPACRQDFCSKSFENLVEYILQKQKQSIARTPRRTSPA
jgi:hypothetical protein